MSAFPAWHMNKEHWPGVRLESDVPDSVIRSLIRDGYDTVAIAQIVLLLAQAGMSVHENFRKVLTLWYENLRSVLAVPSGRIGRAV